MMCVPVAEGRCVYMSGSTYRGQKRTRGFLELEFHMVVSHQSSVLKTEPQPPIYKSRKCSNHRAISPTL